ncbi:MAG TPA: sodium:proton antiporter [Paracoccaceae bacterium]|nr:sodium:proton antiporter [Paracoccaceae bacterium]
MTLLSAIAVGVLFGAGMYAMSHRDLIRLAGGMLLIGNSAVLFLMSATFKGSEAPILPVDDPEKVADPLVQALALTAIVISFATTVLLLRVAMAVVDTHDTLVMNEIGNAEEAEEAEEEREARERMRPADQRGDRGGKSPE